MAEKTKKLKRLSQEKNRLVMQMNRETTKMNKAASSERKARTRTLIQIGGLVDVAGLIEDFDIALGEDLQLDINGQDKATALLGFLVEAKVSMLDENRDEHITENLPRWTQMGKDQMTMSKIKKSYF